MVIKLISCIVKYAINFFKSICEFNDNAVNIRLTKIKYIKKKLFVCIKKILYFIKPINAVFTNTPLKKIEKLVFTSTCVLISQKLNGQTGIFIPKLRNNKLFIQSKS